MRTDHYHKQAETMEWETPQELFDDLNSEFSFDLDVCASDGMQKVDTYFNPEKDGLSQEWSGVCWMNPPYGREIKKWMKKAYEESQKGATVVCLVPARTDSGWWHDYAMKGEIRFIRGRIKFVGAKHNAPFPSAVIILRKGGPRELYVNEYDGWEDYFKDETTAYSAEHDYTIPPIRKIKYVAEKIIDFNNDEFK